MARIQRIVEGQNYDIRKTLWKYSKVLEEQRKDFHALRTDVIDAKAIHTLFESELPDLYSRVATQFGSEVAFQAERAITLHHMDKLWEEHLSHVSHLREGIHLVSLGGLNPLNEFHKHLLEAFEGMQDQLHDQIIASLNEIELTASGIDIDPAILQGPSSTWTYLINDSATTGLQKSLFGQDSSAFAAGAALMAGPLLFGWGIWKRWQQWKDKR